MKKSIYISIILIAIIQLPAFAQSFDWNLTTGGNFGRNGLSHTLGPPHEPGGEPELYWSGGEWAQYADNPVIEGNSLIVYRRWASNPQEESWVINYDVYTGEEKWKITLPVNTYQNYSKVSAVKDGIVYANRAGGASEPEFLYALDIETGEIIWKSEDTFGEHRTETVTFAENGDIIAADIYKILCIDPTNGLTKWELLRGGASSDGASVSAFENKGYYWDQNTQGMFVSVCDLVTGEYLYASPRVGDWGFQQGCLMVAPDGTVYAPRISNNPENDSLVSLTDKGDHFEVNWRIPIAYATMGNHGVGPDNTVYTYSRNDEVVRLDPQTGSVLNTSIVVSDGNGFLSPTMAIGDDGMVYLAVEDWPFHKLYIFSPELEFLWGEEINGLRGVALGDSVMAVCGKGNEIRAYKGRPNPTSNLHEQKAKESIAVYPNPSNGIFNVNGNFIEDNPAEKEAFVDIINVSGEVVFSSAIFSVSETPFTIDISEQKNGIYFLRYYSNNRTYSQKIIKQH